MVATVFAFKSVQKLYPCQSAKNFIIFHRKNLEQIDITNYEDGQEIKEFKTVEHAIW